MAIEKSVLVPDIGDFDGVEVIEVLVAPGDRIDIETSLVTLESDKASMEIPSPFAGVVKEVMIKVGDRVSEGTPLLTVAAEEEATAEAEAVPSGQAPAPVPADRETPSSPTAVAAVGGGQAVEMNVPVPDIGDFDGVEVIEVLVARGDRVEVDASLVTLESDKASMEIPSPYAGEIKEVSIKVGDRVSEGTLLLTMIVEESAAAAAGQQYPEVSAEEVEAVQAPAPSPVEGPGGEGERHAGEKESRRPPVLTRPSDAHVQRPHASPAVRRFARELGVPLEQVVGSGPKQRITKDDVQGFVKQALRQGGAAASAGPLQLPAVPVVDFSRFGEIEERPLSRIRKLSGAHLSACWLNVPHVTQFDEADITSLEAFRKEQKAVAAKQDIRLTFLPFLMKACVGALRELPDFNSSLSPDLGSLIHKKYYHIGVAVDTPNGLMVPVIRDVDKKGIFDLAGELMAVSAKARSGKLLPGDMQGGCFSISSLGGIGGTAFTPIVNAPEVAILGVSRSDTRPVWDGAEFRPRLMLPLSLSYDHRVIDGAQAARFTTTLAGILADIRRLLL